MFGEWSKMSKPIGGLSVEVDGDLDADMVLDTAWTTLNWSEL